ncbi:MAG: sigma-70 family RNA polymerase sigma factor [Planctomycetes bacterium]|nr:sigma-70 family RNA polymerase sigma factor [Planctomycetota bacterium]
MTAGAVKRELPRFMAFSPAQGSSLHGDATARDPSDTEDLSKVEAFLAGDARAFEFLFDKYREKVYRIAYRFVRDKEDALEVSQDVFLKVYLGLRKFKTDSKFFTWLYRIVVNRAIDWVRRAKARPVQELDQAILEAQTQRASGLGGARDPSKTAEERDLESHLALAVQRLSEKHRAVFLLHAMENLSYKEIAAALGCSIGTVMSRLFYARKKLQEILGSVVEPPGRRR